MVIANSKSRMVLLILLKDFSTTHTITSLAKELKISRVGIWKILKKLQSEQFIKLNAVGPGKTSTSIINLNWENILVEKSLALYLTEEAIKQRRWEVNFSELSNMIDFLILYGGILYSTKQAGDIDIIGVVSQKKNFVKIQNIIDKIQNSQIKKIHLINFTEIEFKKELKKPNKAMIDAVKTGVILFGQEKFIRFMRRVAKK